MPRQTRTRRPVRDRFGADVRANSTTVRCRNCNHRLGILWLSGLDGSRGRPGWDGAWLGAKVQRAILPGTVGEDCRSGILDIANEDWQQVTCTRCGHAERKRDAYIIALIEMAPGGEVRLGQLVAMVPPDADGGGWDW